MERIHPLDTQADLPFQVDSPDSLENVESKWIGEISEHCPGVELVLVALKCDLRPSTDEEKDSTAPARPTLTYDQGLEVAKRIKALRYLGMSLHSNTAPHLCNPANIAQSAQR